MQGEIRQNFERVIFDSPPLGAVSDALVLSNIVDGVLLIMKFGHTRQDLLRRALEQLSTIGAPLLGCVLNGVDTSLGNSYGYSYYYYYSSYQQDPEEHGNGRKKKRNSRLAS